MKKFVMYFYNLKHEMYQKVERDYNPKTDRESTQHFDGFYVKSVIVSIKKPPKYSLYIPQRVCNKQKKKSFFNDEKVLF